MHVLLYAITPVIYIHSFAGRQLFVTDKYKKSVIGLTMDGEKRWEISYHGLKNPRGICVVGARLYVAGCRSHRLFNFLSVSVLVNRTKSLQKNNTNTSKSILFRSDEL